jgi:hypothetical protein
VYIGNTVGSPKPHLDLNICVWGGGGKGGRCTTCLKHMSLRMPQKKSFNKEIYKLNSKAYKGQRAAWLKGLFLFLNNIHKYCILVSRLACGLSEKCRQRSHTGAKSRIYMASDNFGMFVRIRIPIFKSSGSRSIRILIFQTFSNKNFFPH